MAMLMAMQGDVLLEKAARAVNGRAVPSYLAAGRHAAHKAGKWDGSSATGLTGGLKRYYKGVLRLFS